MKTLFITGESGTIPMAMQRICALGNESFKVINTQLEKNFVTSEKTHQSFEVRLPELDFLNRDLIDWDELWDQVDLIIHSGAFVGTDYCSSDPVLAIRTNVEGTQNVVDICNKFDIPLIYLSTTAILDPSCYSVISPMTENTPTNPQTLYGITKYAGELIVKNTCKTRTLVLRPVFGFGDYPDDLHSALTKVIYVLYRNVIGKETNLTVLLNELVPKSYTRVENIANCILGFAKILLRDGIGYPVYVHSVYNIGENYKAANDWQQLMHLMQHCFETKKIGEKDDVSRLFKKHIKFEAQKDYLHYHNMVDSRLQDAGLKFDNQKNYIRIDHGIEKTIDSVIKNIDKEPYWL
jgi:nucleoside-diphosphate-sugar epimerase